MSSIQIEQNGHVRTIPLPAGETLLSVLRRAGYSIPAACGGKGRCGKCRVPVNGVPRLACRVYPADGDTVTLPETAGGTILTGTVPLPACRPGRTGCAAAVDLGTTTVVARLYDLAAGTELQTCSGWNAQAPYGADVISRIQYTLEKPDGLPELSRRIREQIVGAGIGRACAQRPHAGHAARDLHSPATPSCSTSSPDTPCAASPQRRSGRRRSLQHPETKRCTACRCTSLPAWRATSAGTLRPDCWPPGWRSCRVKISFSTSAPTARWRSAASGGFVCCAVASGPAFEGAGITCGMPGVDGAISRVRYDRGFLYDVIGGGEPKGLCGSGLLDLTAVLLRLGVIAPGGRLLPPEDAPMPLRRYLTRDDDGNGLLSPDAGGISHGGGRTQLTAGQGRRRWRASACCCSSAASHRSKWTACTLPAASAAISTPRAPWPSACSRARARASCTRSATRRSPARPRSRSTPRSGSASGTSPGHADYLELSGRADFAAAFTDDLSFPQP